MRIETPPAQIADDLWMLGSHEYPVYLATGDGDALLIEGGTGPMASLVVEQLDALAVRAASVRRLVLLHAHPDHVMGVPGFRDLAPEVRVLGSAVARQTLAAEKAVRFFAQIDAAITDALLDRGLIEARHRPKPLAAPTIVVDETIAEGDRVAIGRFDFQVLAAPGHSDCSLALFEPRERILFSSDAAGYRMSDGAYWWPNYFADYQAYLDTIRRLGALGAETLCQGHHGAILGRDEVQAFFQCAAEVTEGYDRRFIDEVRAGKELRPLAEQLGTEVHERSRILPLDFFQKNCGVLIKQSLRREGIAPEK